MASTGEILPRRAFSAGERVLRNDHSDDRTALLPRRCVSNSGVNQLSLNPWTDFEVYRRSAAYYIHQYFDVLADINRERREDRRLQVSHGTDLVRAGHTLDDRKLCRLKISKDAILRDLNLLAFSLQVLRYKIEEEQGSNAVTYSVTSVIAASVIPASIYTGYVLPMCERLVSAVSGASVWGYGAAWREALALCEKDIERLVAAFLDDDVSEENREALGSSGFSQLDKLRDLHDPLV